MHFTDQEVITTALQEALGFYISRLKEAEQQRVQAQPVHGKNPESAADLELETRFQDRIGAAETCLGFKDKIAKEVRGWASTWDESSNTWDDSGVVSDLTVYSIQDFEHRFPDAFSVLNNESPFVDLFGKLHYPITPFSAGPSGQKDEFKIPKETMEDGTKLEEVNKAGSEKFEDPLIDLSPASADQCPSTYSAHDVFGLSAASYQGIHGVTFEELAPKGSAMDLLCDQLPQTTLPTSAPHPINQISESKGQNVTDLPRNIPGSYSSGGINALFTTCHAYISEEDRVAILQSILGPNDTKEEQASPLELNFLAAQCLQASANVEGTDPLLIKFESESNNRDSNSRSHAFEMEQMLEETRKLTFSLGQDANMVNSNRLEATRLLSQWEDEERRVKESFQHALKLQTEWDEQDSLAPQPQDFAVELFPLEEQRIAEEDHQQALRLQMEWDREDTMISQQQKVAGDLARSDAQKLAELQADSKAAALLAQQWESEIRAQLDEMTRVASEIERAEGEAVGRHLNMQESDQLASQREFARGLAKAEEERNFQIQKDMEAATRAQKQWEIETQEQEEYARRIADELARADAELAKQEAQRLAEEEQRARIEKDRIIKEDARRRQREAEVAKSEAQRRARQASCASCMEDLERTDMAMLPCNHWYCGECLSGAFQHALNSKVPFACCKITVSIALATRWLSQDIISAYKLFILELSTKKPVYCSNRSCAKFVPPQHVTGPVAICPLCRTRTCSACSNAEHSGVCAEDKEGLATLKLATKKGWKQCPHCGFILNKTEGCLHMTCRCRAEWCYSCLRDWGSCNSTCNR